jgi:citrate synthase
MQQTSDQTASSPPLSRELAASGGKPVFRGLAGVFVDDSAICEIDNDTDELRYRGYDLIDLITHCMFEDTVHLLLFGEIPSLQQDAHIRETLQSNRELPGAIYDLIRTLPRSADPMAALRTSISALGCYEPGTEHQGDTRLKVLRLISQIPMVIGAFESYRRGVAALAPMPTGSHAAHVLQQVLLRSPDEADVGVMDKVLTIHAEHELNASCFSARVTASTRSNMFAALTSAVGTLSGSLHGGANERVLMAAQAIGKPDAAEAFVVEALARKEKIHGFGQRGCAGEDPRAVVLRSMAEELALRKADNSIFQILTRLHEVMAARTKLWPNVDFYSASVLYSLEIPRDLFTPLFAASRIVGWSAHILEQLANNHLIRPKARYVGPSLRRVAR